MNKVELIGNLTRDPETFGGEVKGTKFTLAVNRDYVNADGERPVDFINCNAWRGLGETVSKYCHKGDKVAVTGSLQTETVEYEDGSKRTFYAVNADSVEFLNLRQNEEPAETEEKAQTPAKPKPVKKAVKQSR